jgi:hypothetical protein
MAPRVSGVPHWGWGGGLKSNLRQPMIREATKETFKTLFG